MELYQRVWTIRHEISSGRAETVQPMAEELVRLYPEYPTAHGLLAEVYAELQRWEEAVEVLQEACRRFPRHRGLQELLQRIEQKRCLLNRETPSSPELSGQLLSEREVRRERDVPLRLVEGAGEATVRLRSSLVRLIPGLEFAPLRSELSVMPVWGNLPPPPPFPATVELALQEAERSEPTGIDLSPLEELARRLESARIPVPDEQLSSVEEEPPPSPLVATETMARIYEQQGAYELALRVYEQLAERYPEKREQYEQAQARLRAKLHHGDS